MYTLILDSATKRLYCALLKDRKLLFEKYVSGKNDHAKYVVDVVNEALNENKITVDNLGELIVGIGPGSYTGVRMAVTVMKMFSTFKEIPLYKISTLKMMSSTFDGITLSYIDARHGNVFASIYDTINDRYLVEEGIYVLDELKALIYEYEVNEDTYEVNPQFVLRHKEKVENPDLLVPNYLRDTEAERNLKND